MDLRSRQVLVVGGSSGIGFATAQAALAAGADVTLASRSADKLRTAAAALGGSVAHGVIDVTDDASVERFFAADKAYDHVVVTAADVRIAPIHDISIAEAQAAMNSKFWGIYRIARAVKMAPGGSLGFIAGFRSQRPGPGLALMSAINAAIEGLTRGLALDLRPLRVNAVSPALVDTELWSGMAPEARAAMIAKMAAHYPAGVVGKPDDIAAALLMLATNPYATGTVLMLDGGASLV
ncbi:SDR family oxidoreductase [Bradyrhizobium sp. 2TAF24]|uniref:SDR family oxidoreductase n=1 Tax=Bradyrhizobium sp. 2TAF24 TaxID=3233011 RepID=UPI003F93F2A4